MREIVLTEEEIQTTCKRLGEQITNDLKNEEKIPVVIGVMKGALNFMMDLIKRIDTPIYTDYIQVSSYVGTETTGVVFLKRDTSVDLTGRTVIIVEDIVDTGISMDYLVEHFKQKGPKNVLVCALFDKIIARKKPVKIDYCGKVLDKNQFLLGYGLDYNEVHRNEPYVFIPAEGEIDELDKKINNDK